MGKRAGGRGNAMFVRSSIPNYLEVKIIKVFGVQYSTVLALKYMKV